MRLKMFEVHLREVSGVPASPFIGGFAVVLADPMGLAPVPCDEFSPNTPLNKAKMLLGECQITPENLIRPWGTRVELF